MRRRDRFIDQLALTGLLLLVVLLIFGFIKKNNGSSDGHYTVKELRKVYSSGDRSNWPEPWLHSSVDKKSFEDIGVLGNPEFPQDNPYSVAKAQLGEALFFEKRLSEGDQVACASCHQPENGWSDSRRRSLGIDSLTANRNSMSLLNIAFSDKFFWDARVNSLEAQVLHPIKNPVEMNQPIAKGIEKIKSVDKYDRLFKAAYGDKSINADRIIKAIATFERTIISGETKFDKFISGDTDMYTDQEVKGLHLYRTKAQCINCHNTPYFSDNQLHNTGLSYFGRDYQDLGHFLASDETEDIGKFKTPTLRNLLDHKPWMHNGNFRNLTEVVDFYNLGNPSPMPKRDINAGKLTKPEGSPILKELQLTEEEKAALIAFLKTLQSREGTSSVFIE